MPAEVSIYPPDQYIFFHPKPDTGPHIPVVENGRVLWWLPDILCQVLQSPFHYLNYPHIKNRARGYGQLIFAAAKDRNPDQLRLVISQYPDIIPQAEEVLLLEDHLLLETARLMTSAIS